MEQDRLKSAHVYVKGEEYPPPSPRRDVRRVSLRLLMRPLSAGRAAALQRAACVAAARCVILCRYPPVGAPEGGRRVARYHASSPHLRSPRRRRRGPAAATSPAATPSAATAACWWHTPTSAAGVAANGAAATAAMTVRRQRSCQLAAAAAPRGGAGKGQSAQPSIDRLVRVARQSCSESGMRQRRHRRSESRHVLCRAAQYSAALGAFDSKMVRGRWCGNDGAGGTAAACFPARRFGARSRAGLCAKRGAQNGPHSRSSDARSLLRWR